MTIQDILSQPWVRIAVVLACALLAAISTFHALRYVARRALRPDAMSAVVLSRCERPFEAVLPILALQFALLSAQPAPARTTWFHALQHAVTIALLAALTWLAIRVVAGVQHAIELRHPANVADNLRARKVQTQTRVLARSGMVLIGVVGVATILMTFPDVRQFGASILASAGVAGIVLGLAARPVLGNLLAGLQIALAEPIRLDDVLIVEGEWGRVEEITGTYVVLHIWDDTRLVIPLQWFIENPFQNWTRTSAEITGQVHLWVDYSLPLAPLRAELERVVNAAQEWDRRFFVLQVVAADEHAMQLRILVSAKDSGVAWNLRCKVREAMIDFLQREYPACLPKLRIDRSPGTRQDRALRPHPAVGAGTSSPGAAS